MSLAGAINTVRKMLRQPLPQAPSFDSISKTLEAEYQLLTNRANNTQNAHLTDTVLVTTVEGTREYTIAQAGGKLPAFYKAMSIVTVPENTTTDAEYKLEFVEVEHFADEWGWLGQNSGQLFSSTHSSHLAAIYRTITNTGEEVRLQLRPTPSESQTYKILFHQGDWWSKVEDDSDLEFGLPFREFKMYLFALASRSLLTECKWCFDDEYNSLKRQELAVELFSIIERNEPSVTEHLSNLENHDIVEIDTGWDLVDY